MSLRENTLFGLEDKEAVAIARFQTFAQQAEAMHGGGYFLAFSGGKDSIVIKDLAVRAGVKFEPIFHWTTVDPPELLEYIREHHADVAWSRPKLSMFQLIVKKKRPPTRSIRYCCEVLKESQGDGRFVVTGVRWEESVARSKRRMTETCYRNARKRYLHPIIDWTSAEVWEYIRSRNLPYCKLYDEGRKRIGCIGCPMAGSDGIKRDFDRWPKFAKAYALAFDKASAEHKKKPAFEQSAHKIIWDSGDAMMRWYMGQTPVPENDEQIMLFE